MFSNSQGACLGSVGADFRQPTGGEYAPPSIIGRALAIIWMGSPYQT